MASNETTRSESKAKMPSPPTLFVAQNCNNCEALEVCRNDNSAQTRCLEVQKISLQKEILSDFRVLHQDLLKIAEALKTSQPVSTAPPAIVPVQRSTRPTSGIQENEIVWIKAWNQSDELYEKALEKDNENSAAYATLVNRLLEKRDEGKKGMIQGDKWYFLSSDGDFVGRKPKKEFSKRT